MIVKTATAKDVQKNFGRFQDEAIRQPVIVTRNGRARTVMLSVEEYERLSRRDRRVEMTAELNDADAAAIVRNLNAAADAPDVVHDD